MRVNTDYLKTLLESRGWSQNMLAKLMKVNKSTVSRLLNGKIRRGRAVFSALMLAFPAEAPDKLFFLDSGLPFGNVIGAPKGGEYDESK